MPLTQHGTWTSDEIELLRKHYGKCPASQLHETCLPNRSAKAIIHMAARLGLNTVSPTWTPAELSLLLEHYRDCSPEELREKYLPGRSPRAIQEMARRLRTREHAEHKTRHAPTPVTPWTAEEIEAVRTNYPYMSAEKLRDTKLPNRTPGAICQMAHQLSLTKTSTVVPYTDHELAVIRQFLGNVTPECMRTLLPDRTYDSMKKHADAVGGRASAHNENRVRNNNQIRRSAPQRTVAVMPGLSCSVCGEPIRPGDEILICPECAAVFCTDHETEAKTHVAGHAAMKPPRKRRKHNSGLPAEQQTLLRQFYRHVAPHCLTRMVPGYTVEYIRELARGLGGLASDKARNDRVAHYQSIQKTIAVMTGLSCAACGEPVHPGDDIVICPECAAVFCADHVQEAQAHFMSHHTEK